MRAESKHLSYWRRCRLEQRSHPSSDAHASGGSNGRRHLGFWHSCRLKVWSQTSSVTVPTYAQCKQELQWQQVLELPAEMQASGLEPAVIKHSATISACEQRLQWPQAIGLLALMQGQGLEPSIISHSADMSSCRQRLQ